MTIEQSLEQVQIAEPVDITKIQPHPPEAQSRGTLDLLCPVSVGCWAMLDLSHSVLEWQSALIPSEPMALKIDWWECGGESQSS